eukprot:TRINITY_DN10100_c0_g1_i1.p1 TRINITY_DN10100_c0_g1~~TRINITY_DN10100_c0_g1_i1.p1  ORF type:complete len:626 (-),score=65.46 TRINITY_DN10100_c0_g1_i1:76-1953(-)
MTSHAQHHNFFGEQLHDTVKSLTNQDVWHRVDEQLARQSLSPDSASASSPAFSLSQLARPHQSQPPRTASPTHRPGTTVTTTTTNYLRKTSPPRQGSPAPPPRRKSATYIPQSSLAPFKRRASSGSVAGSRDNRSVYSSASRPRPTTSIEQVYMHSFMASSPRAKQEPPNRAPQQEGFRWGSPNRQSTRHGSPQRKPTHYIAPGVSPSVRLSSGDSSSSTTWFDSPSDGHHHLPISTSVTKIEPLHGQLPPRSSNTGRLPMTQNGKTGTSPPKVAPQYIATANPNGQQEIHLHPAVAIVSPMSIGLNSSVSTSTSSRTTTTSHGSRPSAASVSSNASTATSSSDDSDDDDDTSGSDSDTSSSGSSSSSEDNQQQPYYWQYGYHNMHHPLPFGVSPMGTGGGMTPSFAQYQPQVPMQPYTRPPTPPSEKPPPKVQINVPADENDEKNKEKWLYVQHMLMSGRIFRKHCNNNKGKRMTSKALLRFVYLTRDAKYLAWCKRTKVNYVNYASRHDLDYTLPTYKGQKDNKSFIPLNDIRKVVIGETDEEVGVNWGKAVMDFWKKPYDPSCLISFVANKRTLTLEVSTPEEAEYVASAWNFYLYNKLNTVVPQTTYVPTWQQKYEPTWRR